jgi:glycosyltransferase involved in cell wall biosynthesis
MNLNNYMPKLSIIIPTYNRSNYLEQSLKSIFDQDFKDFEIIVVDNNSTDSTMDVIDKFSNDKRLK